MKILKTKEEEYRFDEFLDVLGRWDTSISTYPKSEYIIKKLALHKHNKYTYYILESKNDGAQSILRDRK